jgi:hypothetical protein
MSTGIDVFGHLQISCPIDNLDVNIASNILLTGRFSHLLEDQYPHSDRKFHMGHSSLHTVVATFKLL